MDSYLYLLILYVPSLYFILSYHSLGPLFLQDGSHKPTLIGAVSFGKPCGYVNSAVMYAKIDHVLDWITETMEKYP